MSAHLREQNGLNAGTAGRRQIGQAFLRSPAEDLAIACFGAFLLHAQRTPSAMLPRRSPADEFGREHMHI